MRDLLFRDKKGSAAPAAAVVLLVAVLIVLGIFGISGRSGPLRLPPVATQAGFAPLAKKVEPAVVQIAATQIPENNAQLSQATPGTPGTPQLPQGPFGDLLRRFFDQYGGQEVQPEVHALGSGFIVDPAGYIVTNNHVVDEARDISVTLTDGNKYSAKVIGRDNKTDIALLKINAGGPLPYVVFGNSDKEQVGDWVIAVGNPYGLGGTVTAGIISAHGRNINQGPYDDFLQIDAPINPGNSGGPLFDQSGQVIGIDTAIYTPTGASVGIGFAIPSNVAQPIVTDLRKHGTVARGWVGVEMQDMTQPLARAMGLPRNEGVLVDSVENDSPASRAGLQQGDVITAFANRAVKSTRDLALAVADTPKGRTVPLTVWRSSHQLALQITVGSERNEEVAAAQTNAANPARVGMTLEGLTPDLRGMLKINPSTPGVVVTQVTPGSEADQSGLETGDVIERVAGNVVGSPEQVAEDIRAAQQQRKPAIPVQIVRAGTTYYLGLELPAG